MLKSFDLQAVFLLLGLLLSGCASSGPVNEDGLPATMTTTAAGQSEPTDSPMHESGGILPLTLILDSCTGFGFHRFLISSAIEAEHPNGWAESSSPLTEQGVEAFICKRLSLGRFERANVSFLLEAHDNQQAPENCADGLGDIYSSSEVIHQIWVSDREVLGFMLGLGLPARYGIITKEIAGEDAGVVTWTLETEGFESDTLHQQFRGAADSGMSITWRRYWTNPLGGISYMDYDFSWSVSELDVPPMAGTLGAPFLHYNGVDAFAHVAAYYPPDPPHPTHVNAPFYQFADMECKVPVPF